MTRDLDTWLKACGMPDTMHLCRCERRTPCDYQPDDDLRPNHALTRRPPEFGARTLGRFPSSLVTYYCDLALVEGRQVKLFDAVRFHLFLKQRLAKGFLSVSVLRVQLERPLQIPDRLIEFSQLRVRHSQVELNVFIVRVKLR